MNAEKTMLDDVRPAAPIGSSPAPTGAHPPSTRKCRQRSHAEITAAPTKQNKYYARRVRGLICLSLPVFYHDLVEQLIEAGDLPPGAEPTRAELAEILVERWTFTRREDV